MHSSDAWPRIRSTHWSQRRVVKPEFVQHLLERHRSEHASYYGVMIWVLMMLEQWLQSHPQARLDT
jgi:asparagine synthase (glutamine-hydrolysing)